MLKRIIVFAAIMTSIMLPAAAQATKADPTDLQTWTSVGTEVLYKRWDASFTYQLRLEGNSKTYKGSYWSPEVGFQFHKLFRTFVNYRYANTTGGISGRWGFGAEYGQKFNRWSVSFRPQMQLTQQVANDGETSSPDKWMLRAKAGVKYALSGNWDLYGSVEPFYSTSGNMSVDNIRNIVGVKWGYAPSQKIDFYFMYRPDYGKKYQRTYFVVGIKWEYGWKLGRKTCKGEKHPVSASH